MEKLLNFVQECIKAEKQYESELETTPPNGRFSKQPAIMESLKTRAKSLGLFNLFFYPQYEHIITNLLPSFHSESVLQVKPRTILEYAKYCEIMGLSPKIAPEACNCNAPDTGNMELLAKYASPSQQRKFLVPLLKGETRSAFAMTEPNVASSDAVNIATSIEKDENGYVVNGKKCWISNGGHPLLSFFLVFGVSNPTHPKPHHRHSIIIVPKDAKGVILKRPMTVFGYDDAVEGHYEIEFNNVHVPFDNIVLGEGKGFEIVQGRLGPGRIHHCMRAIGMAERVMFELVKRVNERVVFGKKMATFGDIQMEIAKYRVRLEQARLLVYNAAEKIDKVGAKDARLEIAMIKVAVPNMLCDLIDYSIQVFGGAGVGQDEILAKFYAAARTLRIADGPDAVHLMQIAKAELSKL